MPRRSGFGAVPAMPIFRNVSLHTGRNFLMVENLLFPISGNVSRLFFSYFILAVVGESGIKAERFIPCSRVLSKVPGKAAACLGSLL